MDTEEPDFYTVVADELFDGTEAPVLAGGAWA